MQRVHFIAIGGLAMHQIAIALSKKNNFEVDGSDVEFASGIAQLLKVNKLLPSKAGWAPERIHKGLNAVVIDNSVMPDNPEMLKARELGLKIYHYSEFLLHQTRSKTRIAVAGGPDKHQIASLILHVIKSTRIDADYWLSSCSSGDGVCARLTYDARIALFEIDEYPVTQSKYYKPHIAVLARSDEGFAAAEDAEQEYLTQFKSLVDVMEVQGRVICYGNLTQMSELAESMRRDLVTFTYAAHPVILKEGQKTLKSKYTDLRLPNADDNTLRNIEAARLACRQFGIRDDQFYEALPSYFEK